MKRMHVPVAVEDIPNAIGFYTALFAMQPAVVKPDYAKWMLDDPCVNFAISTRGRQPGLDHLGISGRGQGRTERNLCAPAQRQRQCHCARANKLLLRKVRKVVDR